MSMTFDSRDEYKRQIIAEKLSKIIDSSTDISPIVIDGNWGTGKTEFSLKLMNYIKNNYPEKKVIYIDAFKEDNCGDPLLSVTAAIAKELPAQKKEALIKKAVPAIKFTAATALKAGAGWILKQEVEGLAEDFQQAIMDTSNAAIDGTIKNLLKEHIESENNISALKEKIREIANENQIIIIVDELDRCRPNFSVDMLEKIKHIFDIEKVFFILVTNLNQLKASVNHIYGNSVDSQSYLDKFIKYTLTLPETFKPDGYTLVHTSESHWQGLAASSEKHRDSCYLMRNQISELLRIRPLSLRETETFFRYYTIFQTLSPDMISNGKMYSWNLTVLSSIYMYCFGEKRAINQFPSKQSIKSLSNLMMVDSFDLKVGINYNIPHYLYIFYGISKESEGIYPNLIEMNEENKKEFDDFLLKLNKDSFNRFSYTRTIKSVFETFSFT